MHERPRKWAFFMAYIPALLVSLALLIANLNIFVDRLYSAFFWVILATLGIATVSIQRINKKDKPAFLWLAPTFYLVMLLVSLFSSQSRQNSVDALQTLAIPSVLVLAGSFYLFRDELHSWDSRTSSRAICLIGVFFSFWSLIEMLQGQRPSGPFQDINTFAAFFNVLIILSAGSILAGNGNHSGKLILFLISAGQAAEVSRGANLSLFLALVVLLGVAVFYFRVPRKPLLTIVAIILAAQLAVMAIAPSTRTAQQAAESSTSRIDMWESSLEAFRSEKSWLGTGLGTYLLVYPQYRHPTETLSSGDHAHNDYIENLLEGGPLLLLSTVLFFVAAPLWMIRKLVSKAQSDEPVSSTIQSVAGCAACLCLSLHASVNFIFSTAALGVLFSYCFLTGAASEKILVTPGPGRFSRAANHLRAPKFIPGIVSGSFFSVFIVTQIIIIYGAWIFTPAGTRWCYENQSLSTKLIYAGISIQPRNSYFNAIIAQRSLSAVEKASNPVDRLNKARRADLDIKQWLDANRRNVAAWQAMAQLSDLAPQVASFTALDSLRFALIYKPYSLKTRLDLFREFSLAGNSESAYQALFGGFFWLGISPYDHDFFEWRKSGLKQAIELNKSPDYPLWNRVQAE